MGAKGIYKQGVPMEQGIATVREFLGQVPACMCFIFEPYGLLYFLSGVS